MHIYLLTSNKSLQNLSIFIRYQSLQKFLSFLNEIFLSLYQNQNHPVEFQSENNASFDLFLKNFKIFVCYSY